MGPATSPGSAGLMTPPAQKEVAGALGQIAGPLVDISSGGGAGTPGAWAYPQAQQLYSPAYNSSAQYLTGDWFGGQPTLFDQNAGLAVGSAQNAGNIYGGLMPDIYNQIPGLTSGAGSLMSYLPQVLGNAFNPMYGQAVNDVASNPYYAGAMGGAQRGAALGGQGAENLYGMGQGIMMSGFDPQSALYGRGQQRALDRANAMNAMSGVGTSPYGAGTANAALNNFDLDWQDRQLGRQTSAGQAAQSLFGAAPGLAATSAALPSATYMGQIDALLKALNQQIAASGMGVTQGGGLLQGAGNAFGQADTLGKNIAANTAQFGGLPYSTGATIGSNAQSSIANLLQQLTGTSTLGNQQFSLPLSVMTQLQDYLTGGRNAAQISGQLSNMGFNQQAQGIGGLLGGANMLFNPTSGMFPGAMGSLGGMLGLGGAGAAAGGLGSMAAFAPFMLSDRRLKRDISRIGTLKNGLPVYRFRYLWDAVERIGLMADEVERAHPEAVLEGPLGFKMVNYAAAMR